MLRLAAVVSTLVLPLLACAPDPYEGTRHAPPFAGDDDEPDGPSLPNPPEAVSAAAGHYQVNIEWSTEETQQYNLYWSLEPDIDAASADRWGGVAPPFTHSGLENGTEYFYAVTAVEDDQEGDPSEEISAIPVPPAPTGLFRRAMAWSSLLGLP
jgi:hypothetical protein